LFNSDAFRAEYLQRFGISGSGTNYRESVEQALDELAEHMEKHLDVDGLLKIARPIRF
jgi:adenosylcobyric acid synthase